MKVSKWVTEDVACKKCGRFEVKHAANHICKTCYRLQYYKYKEYPAQPTANLSQVTSVDNSV